MIKKIYLAPIKGITDRTFHNVFCSCFTSVDTIIAPFVTESYSEKKLNDALSSSKDKYKLIPQILSKSEDQFIRLAKRFADGGAVEVNWNLGCPFKKVIDRGEGAALLKSPDAIKQFLDKVCSQLHIPVSVKMRLGLKDYYEIFPVIEILNNYPLKEIIIHPRTADQMYDGDINIKAFTEAIKLSDHKIVYNGDITHYKDIDYIRGITGELHGWMIGRGLLINPLLAEEIHAGQSAFHNEKIKRIKQFADSLFKEYQTVLQSSTHVLDKMHGIWSYLSQNFQNSKKIEKRIRKTSSLQHYLDEIDKLFEKDPVIINTESVLMKEISF